MQRSSVRLPRRSRRIFSHWSGEIVRLVLMGHRPSCVPVVARARRLRAGHSSCEHSPASEVPGTTTPTTTTTHALKMPEEMNARLVRCPPRCPPPPLCAHTHLARAPSQSSEDGTRVSRLSNDIDPSNTSYETLRRDDFRIEGHIEKVTARALIARSSPAKPSLPKLPSPRASTDLRPQATRASW
jgi:hypothetical protein